MNKVQTILALQDAIEEFAAVSPVVSLADKIMGFCNSNSVGDVDCMDDRGKFDMGILSQSFMSKVGILNMPKLMGFYNDWMTINGDFEKFVEEKGIKFDQGSLTTIVVGMACLKQSSMKFLINTSSLKLNPKDVIVLDDKHIIQFIADNHRFAMEDPIVHQILSILNSGSGIQSFIDMKKQFNLKSK